LNPDNETPCNALAEIAEKAIAEGNDDLARSAREGIRRLLRTRDEIGYENAWRRQWEVAERRRTLRVIAGTDR